MLVSQFTRAVRRNIPKLTRSFAIHELPVPSLGDSISDGTLVEFLKTPGMGVETDEIVAVIETDKVSIDIRSPFAGTVTTLLAEADDTVVVGQAIMALDSDLAATVESDSPAAIENVSPPTSTISNPSPVTIAAPSPTPSTPVPAPPSNHGRRPSIQFRHGDRATIDALFAPTGGTVTAAPLSPNDEEFLSLPSMYRRLPMTEKEMDLINMGGAGEDDIDVKLQYV